MHWPPRQADVNSPEAAGRVRSDSVGTGSHWYADALSKKYLATDAVGKPAATVGPGATYDLYNPEARAYAWNAMQEGYVEQYGLHHW